MLEQALLELEQKIKALAEELATIRKYVIQLEEDNQALQAIVRKKNSQISGRSNIIALFEAGFHVCPSHFGALREGECIFCESFIEKENLRDSKDEAESDYAKGN